MRKTTAQNVAQYLDALRGGNASGYTLHQIGGPTPLHGFHEWADGKPLVAAYEVRSDDAALIALIIDWHNR